MNTIFSSVPVNIYKHLEKVPLTLNFFCFFKTKNLLTFCALYPSLDVTCFFVNLYNLYRACCPGIVVYVKRFCTVGIHQPLLSQLSLLLSIEKELVTRFVCVRLVNFIPPK